MKYVLVSVLLAFALLISNNKNCQAQDVRFFANVMNEKCQLSVSQSKKIFLTVLKSQDRSNKICEEAQFRELLSACSDKEKSCELVLNAFTKSEDFNSGRVLGQ